MLKEGDSVTLSVSFPIKVADFEYLKPHASVTRKLSDDLAGDLHELEAALREALLRSARECLSGMSELSVLLEQSDGDIDVMAEQLTTLIGGTHESEIEVDQEEEDPEEEEEDEPEQVEPTKKPAKKKVGGIKGKLAKKKKPVKKGAASLAKGKGPKRKKVGG